MNEEFKQGDIAECPYCGTEFQLDYVLEEEYDDFDQYFEHVSVCGRTLVLSEVNRKQEGVTIDELLQTTT